jgi:hypothetical protein
LYDVLDNAASVAIESLDSRLEDLGGCYDKLPMDDRHLIDARFRSGVTVEAIAAELARSIHSVYRSLRRIYKTLFDCVQHQQEREA